MACRLLFLRTQAYGQSFHEKNTHSFPRCRRRTPQCRRRPPNGASPAAPPWQVELVQFQELTDRLDVLRRLTGIRIQQQYNIILQNGWTLGATALLRVLQATIRIFHRPLVASSKNSGAKAPPTCSSPSSPTSIAKFTKVGTTFTPAGLSSPSSPTSPTFRRTSGLSPLIPVKRAIRSRRNPTSRRAGQRHRSR